MNPSAQMVQTALGQPAFDPKKTVQVAVDPRRREFEWRHGSRHDFGSVGAINALAQAQAKREAKKDKRRQTITKNAQRYAGRSGGYVGDNGLNPITFICPPPKPSGPGSNIVSKFFMLHRERDEARKDQAFRDRLFADETRARWAREEAFRKTIEAGHDPLGEDDEHEHVHGPGCGHDHTHSHGLTGAEDPVVQEIHDSIMDMPDDTPSSLHSHAHVHGPDCGCDHDKASKTALNFTATPPAAEPPTSDGFYAAGSDSSGNRLGAPVLVTAKDYVPPVFKVLPPSDVAVPGHELVVMDGRAPAPTEPISDAKVLANKAWLVTWMLANGRATELKSNEALKQMKSDTHALRRGKGVPKDAIPNAEVIAIMKDLGIAMPTRVGE